MRRLSLLLVASILLGARRAPDLEPPPAKRFQESNWLQFSNRIDDRRTYAAPVTPDNVENLHVEWTIKLPEIVDSAPIYVSNVKTDNGIRARMESMSSTRPNRLIVSWNAYGALFGLSAIASPSRMSERAFAP